MRAFIALAVPEELVERYRSVVPELGERYSSLRWVRPEALHVTLCFLGEVEDSLADELSRPVGRAVATHSPFAVRFGGVGVFGSRDRPRVVWIGIDDPDGRLSRLQREVEGVVRDAGFSPDRKPWRPHVTIGRARDRERRRGAQPAGSADVVATIEELAGNALSEESGPTLVVRELVLLASVLGPGGSVYTPRWCVRLEEHS